MYLKYLLSPDTSHDPQFENTAVDLEIVCSE
jgi:hypothetical protein